MIRVAAALALLLPTAAFAAGCGPKADVLAALARDYHEAPVWAGTAAPGPLLLTVSPAGTWTMLAMRAGPDGGLMACLVLDGKDGAVLPVEPKDGT